jgi:hypothetical protein
LKLPGQITAPIDRSREFFWGAPRVDGELLKRGITISTGHWSGLDNDIHDWLGGYPYESADADFIRGFVTRIDLSLIRENVKPPGSGRFGTRCDEFVFRRTGAI